jgi:hypothetical protein
MRFRRKREVWGVLCTRANGEQLTIYSGSLSRARGFAASLQVIYADARLVRLPRG